MNTVDVNGIELIHVGCRFDFSPYLSAESFSKLQVICIRPPCSYGILLRTVRMLAYKRSTGNHFKPSVRCKCVQLHQCFFIGTVMVIAGMGFFTLGADAAMTPIGNKIGTALTKTKNMPLILTVSFVLGFAVTVAEPDLQVLAGQVPSIPNAVLIIAVAAGVGLFLIAALLRMFFGISLRLMLILAYIVVFALAAFVPRDFLAVAFDSGGVTTGPMTVPFIMALGVGVSSIRSDSRAGDDSFGLIALCSVGPILAVMTLGLIFPAEGAFEPTAIPDIGSSTELARYFISSIPAYLGEIAVALLPIIVFFGIFQAVTLRLPRRQLRKIIVGLVYTYVGLVLFLTGANVGFMPAGSYLGKTMASLPYNWIIIPVGMVIGYFIVRAEPAVYVLNKQVEEITDGAISSKAMGACLSLGVAASIGLALVRVLTGISILWFVVPGYAIAIGLSFLVPRIFTAIAFDSGGVASGPMTATFLLPFAQGACLAVGGNIVADAFGVVAMVAMTPLITIQVLGLIYRIKKSRAGEVRSDTDGLLPGMPDDAIIEL